MGYGFEVYFPELVEQTQLESIFSDNPNFVHMGQPDPTSWHFQSDNPPLPGCAWAFEIDDKLEPLEPETMALVTEMLGGPPQVAFHVESSSEDLHGKNALAVIVLVAKHWPNLLVNPWNEHLHTAAECQAFWDAGKGFPWAHCD